MTTTYNTEPFMPGVFNWTPGWNGLEKEFTDMEKEINPLSQEWEILLSQFPCGLTSLRKDNRKGQLKYWEGGL